MTRMTAVHSFFFNDTATTEIYTLSLHDALPIWRRRARHAAGGPACAHRVRAADRRALHGHGGREHPLRARGDRKSTRLNSSHSQISYAVFCLKKKIKKIKAHAGFRHKVASVSAT